MKRNRVYWPGTKDMPFPKEDKKRFERLMAVLDSSFDGIYLTDEKAMTLWCNRSYTLISGMTADQVVGRTMQELEQSGLISRSATLIALERQEAVTIEQVFQTGKRVVVTSTPIFDSKNQIVMVVTNVRDISEITSLQESLEKHRALNQKYRNELEIIRTQLMESDELVAEDPVMLDLIRMVSRAAMLETVVLIQGETGVGKERVASYIHQHSTRRNKSFLRVNCGAIPESLAESELFGYEKGAFTGANREGKPGLFETADHGTVFLDEVGELSLPIQTKLLRVLQEQEITRVGGSQPIKVDVRILAATNRDLREAVAKGAFREDLYYRLSVFPVEVPPLRERKKDILVLANNMLEELNQKYGKTKELTPTAVTALLQYCWPGNVRQLRNVIERAFIMSDDNEIIAEDLALFGGRGEQGHREAGSFQTQVERFEARLLAEAYSIHKSIRGAARSLDMDPATYLRKKTKYEEKGAFHI